MRGVNLACDAGTYLYSGEGTWRNGLARTSVHNTVTVDGLDQMELLSRFTWVHWAGGRVLRQGDIEGLPGWQGEHDGYRRLAEPVAHRRTLLNLESDRWLVLDHLAGEQAHDYRLHWLLPDLPCERDGNGIHLRSGREVFQVRLGTVDTGADPSIARCDPESTRGWRSRYYGHKQAALSVALDVRAPGGVTFWSFFGFEGDLAARAGKGLRIRLEDRELDFDLQRLGV
jgi:asparagine synthase (glutamine-hydrolysing)